MDGRRLNNILGWSIGGVATLIYGLTLAPSASFWDCGEFITVAYGLQVGHPPGAPVYQLLAHLFTLLAGGNMMRVAWWSNMLSALAGGVTVMMLFWTLTMMLEKMRWKYLGAIVGAACYMLCDTAWFSAVESEVYSLAVMMAAIMLWAMLKWERCEDRRQAPRWLLLEALLLGLSVGVHLLSLLVAPALLLIFILSKRNEWKMLWRVMPLAVGLFVVGLSPYLIVPIRANANPPINQGNPATAEAFKKYVNREQYDHAPLWPRMWRERDAKYAKSWSENGSEVKYMMSYQMFYMYLRYLLWNFSGRYNDTQGFATMMNGQFVTGIPPIDRQLVGTGARIPESLPKESHNVYFLLPLLLGLIGLVMQSGENRKRFWTVMTLFLMGGFVLGIYLNHPIYEPRERDYAYVLSFYAFAMWIGVGAAWLSNYMGRYFPYLLLGVPLLMGVQNWDDHDRSNRWIANDSARALLNSCDKDAILFTYGDNDTFPLWYVQQVEEVRKDVRVENINLMGGSRAMMNLMIENNFERPVFMSHYAYNNLKEVFRPVLRLEGNAYRMMPARTDSVDVEAGYEKVMNRIVWRDMSRCYIDNVSCRFLEQYWQDVIVLAQNLMAKGEGEKVLEVLNKTMGEIALDRIQNPEIGWSVFELYYRAGDRATAKRLHEKLRVRLKAELDYYHTIKPKRQRYVHYSIEPREKVMQALEDFKW